MDKKAIYTEIMCQNIVGNILKVKEDTELPISDKIDLLQEVLDTAKETVKDITKELTSNRFCCPQCGSWFSYSLYETAITSKLDNVDFKLEYSITCPHKHKQIINKEDYNKIMANRLIGQGE